MRTYLEACGLASFQGIERDVADPGQLKRLSEWRPAPIRLAAPTFEAAGALVSDPKLGQLRKWQPLVNRREAATFRAAVALLGNPAINSLRKWHCDLADEEETDAT